MAVTADYLTKIRRAVRVNSSVDIDNELIDVIEECRLDLQRIGVITSKTIDETDSLILGAVRSFARWKFSPSDGDAEANRNDYMLQRDELRRSRDYMGYAITFAVKNGSAVAIPDASITFNGETIETGAAGTAVFYRVKAGVNQEYTVSADGYASQTVDLDVTATATVNVTMVAR